MVAPGSSLGLSCPREGLGIQLGVDFPPGSEPEPGGFLPKGYIIGQAGREIIFHLAGSYNIEIAHEVSRPHGLVGKEIVAINAVTPHPLSQGGDYLLPGFPWDLQVLTFPNL